MAIKIPNTLEPANNDFPVVSSDHIDVDELDERKNLTQYLKDVYAELTETLETNHGDDDKDRQRKYDDLVSHLNALLGNSDDGDKSIEDQLTDLRKLLLLSLFGNETYEPSNEDNADGSGRNITNKIRDLRNSILGWLYSNTDSIGKRINNLSSTLSSQLTTLLTQLTTHDSTISSSLNSESSNIIKKIENLDDKLSGLLGNDATSIASMLEAIEDRIKKLDIELTGVEGLAHSEDNSSYIYAITNAVRDVIQQQITNLDTELTGDGTAANIGKIMAAKVALDETLSSISSLITQLDSQLTGTNDAAGQLESITNAVTTALNTQVNDIKYSIKNTTDRIHLTVLNISRYNCDIKCDVAIDTEVGESLDVISYITTISGTTVTVTERPPISVSGSEYKMPLSPYVPTKMTFNIKKSGDIVYSKSIEVMRKAPVYVGHSDNGDITTFNTTIFNKNYLTDSLYGECEIPANSWVNENKDAYLYITIPKEFFRQKTVQIFGGTGIENVNLQLLQNGFPVGGIHEKTVSGYHVYRSSQMISEHSNLELK